MRNLTAVLAVLAGTVLAPIPARAKPTFGPDAVPITNRSRRAPGGTRGVRVGAASAIAAEPVVARQVEPRSESFWYSEPAGDRIGSWA